jgi:hypothetical protein
MLFVSRASWPVFVGRKAHATTGYQRSFTRGLALSLSKGVPTQRPPSLQLTLELSPLRARRSKGTRDEVGDATNSLPRSEGERTDYA